MSLALRLKKMGVDVYLLLLLGTVGLATLLPARGQAVGIVSDVAYYAVSLLFFLYGAKLNTAAIVAGMANWRLQALVLLSTYLLFPVLGITLAFALSPWLPPEIAVGIIYLSVLPSTVQSSIAFTSIAGGNVPAAVCAASVSNLIGIFLTPLFAALLLHTAGGLIDLSAILRIALQILLPFLLGQLARPLIGAWISRHPRLTNFVDRGAILLIVYSAFSAGVVAGIWSEVDLSTIAIIIGADILMLTIVMLITGIAGRLVGLAPTDQVVLFFCGSKKSLASGLPMANILFAGQAVSLIVLPIMLFHQIQLFVSAIIAQRRAHALAEVKPA